MAYAMNVAALAGNSKSLIDTTNARQARIIANGAPSLWLSPEKKYFSATASGKISAWYDALNPKIRFVPNGSSPPYYHENSDKSLANVQWTSTNGEALIDESETDILPPNGSPISLAMLVKVPSSAGQGAIVGSRAAKAEANFIVYIDNSSHVANLWASIVYGSSAVDKIYGLTSLAGTNWNIVIFTGVGTATGGGIYLNGTSDLSVTGGTITPPLTTNGRKLLLGAASSETDYMKANLFLGSIICIPKNLAAPENASLMADILAELTAYKAGM